MGVNVSGIWAAWSIALLVIGLAACEQETEGCLDFDAVAIDIDADNPCEDCCVYPRLSLNFVVGKFLGDSVAFRTQNSLLPQLNGDTLKLAQLGFYVSDMTLLFTDGREVLVKDTFSFRQNNTTAYQRDSLSVYRYSLLSNQSRNNVGVIRGTGTIRAIRFAVGLGQELATLNVSAQLMSSVLSSGADSLLLNLDNGRLLPAVIAFNNQDGEPAFSTSVAGNGQQQVTLDFATPVLLERGFNLRLGIALDIDRLVALSQDAATPQSLASVVFDSARVISVVANRP